jgi:hypothetical protein
MNRWSFSPALVLTMVAFLLVSGCDQRRGASDMEKPNPQTKSVAGVTFYYGVLKAGIVEENPADRAESLMHEGPPETPASYHVVLTLIETASKKRIADAKVAMRLDRSDTASAEWVTMDAMRGKDSETYGQYAKLPDPGFYLIEFRVERAGMARPITARFALSRPE